MRVPPTPFDDGYDVRGPKATRVGKESARTTVPMFHRPATERHTTQSTTHFFGRYSLALEYRRR